MKRKKVILNLRFLNVTIVITMQVLALFWSAVQPWSTKARIQVNKFTILHLKMKEVKSMTIHLSFCWMIKKGQKPFSVLLHLRSQTQMKLSAVHSLTVNFASMNVSLKLYCIATYLLNIIDLFHKHQSGTEISVTFATMYSQLSTKHWTSSVIW